MNIFLITNLTITTIQDPIFQAQSLASQISVVQMVMCNIKFVPK